MRTGDSSFSAPEVRVKRSGASRSWGMGSGSGRPSRSRHIRPCRFGAAWRTWAHCVGQPSNRLSHPAGMLRVALPRRRRTSRPRGSHAVSPTTPSLTWPRAQLVVVPMSTDELVSSLSVVPDARRLVADPPLSAAVMVAGIEVATTGPAPERALRRIWRERRGSGATPLLLVADEPGRPGCVSVLGPSVVRQSTDDSGHQR